MLKKFRKIMVRQVWQADDGSTFETEQECQEYERKQKLLLDLYLAIFDAKEGDKDKDKIWGFQEGFLCLFDQLGKEELIRHKKDFRRIADIIDGKIPNPLDQRK